MAMTQDDRTELIDTYKMLSADELRGMKGDDAETDALIDEVLGAGKAVEMKNPAEETDPASPADPAAKDDPADGEEEDEEDEDDPADPAAKPDPAAEAAAQAAQAQAAQEAAAAAAAEAAKANVPALDLTALNADFSTRAKALDAANAADLQKMMDGEIDAGQYATAQAKYLADRDALRDEKALATGWVSTVHDFQAKALADGTDYFRNKEHATSLDDWVRRLAARGVPDDQVLAQAHKKVLAEFDLAPGSAAAAAPAKPDPAPAKPNKARAPDLSNIPPTLGGLPAAADPGDSGGGEFSHIDNLTGMAQEQAIARLTPDQRARYEAE